MPELNCPKCKSENTQKLSAIVDSGTSRSQSNSIGSVGGVVGTTPAFGITNSTTSTVTQSNLAKKLAAPRKKLPTTDDTFTFRVRIAELAPGNYARIKWRWGGQGITSGESMTGELTAMPA